MQISRGLFALMFLLALALGASGPMPAAADMQPSPQGRDVVAITMTCALCTSGLCNSCVKKDGAKQVCLVVCAGLQAVLPVASPLRVAVRMPFDPLAAREFNGAGLPPDLPPPKLSSIV
jgi:hypothetical protein